MMLPTTRHVRELIEHSEEHARVGSERDLKIALIHVDNSIEILLKEYLRYEKEQKMDDIEKISFYQLMKICGDIAVVKSSKNLFMAFHDMRNAIYHLGNLSPPKEDVKSAIDLAKSLFNELHPSVEFKNAEVTLPSQESINLLTSAVGNKPYITELAKIQQFSVYMQLKGYDVLVEHVMGKDRQYRADLIASKDDNLIVCEFKSRITDKTVLLAIRQLKDYMSLAEAEFPARKIEGWLIAYQGNISMSDKEAALRLGIRILDSKALNGLLSEEKENFSRLTQMRKKSF